MMRIISNKILRDFYTQPKYFDSKGAITAWYSDTKKAEWNAPQDIKNVYANASFVANNRVVFLILVAISIGLLPLSTMITKLCM